MGSIGQNLFGGSSNKSSSSSNSYNQAYNYLNGQLSPAVAAGTNATTTESNLLTGTGDPASSAAFKNYLGSTGYNFQQQQGEAGITGSAAAKGLLGSGSTLKSLDSYNQNLASGAYQNYLTDLGNVANQGTSAANTIAGAGSVSNSSSSGKGSSSTGIVNSLFG